MYSDLNLSYQQTNDIESQITEKEFHLKTENFIDHHQRIKFSRFKLNTFYT